MSTSSVCGGFGVSICWCCCVDVTVVSWGVCGVDGGVMIVVCFIVVIRCVAVIEHVVVVVIVLQGVVSGVVMML